MTLTPFKHACPSAGNPNTHRLARRRRSDRQCEPLCAVVWTGTRNGVPVQTMRGAERQADACPHRGRTHGARVARSGEEPDGPRL